MSNSANRSTEAVTINSPKDLDLCPQNCHVNTKIIFNAQKFSFKVLNMLFINCQVNIG